MTAAGQSALEDELKHRIRVERAATLLNETGKAIATIAPAFLTTHAQ